jgi:hypothetical protein
MLQVSVGACYFLLGFYDQKLKFPYIQSFIFLGKNLFPPIGDELWYFQQPDYFAENFAIEYDSLENSGVITIGVDGIDAVSDINGLIEALSTIRGGE